MSEAAQAAEEENRCTNVEVTEKLRRCSGTMAEERRATDIGDRGERVERLASGGQGIKDPLETCTVSDAPTVEGIQGWRLTGWRGCGEEMEVVGDGLHE